MKKTAVFELSPNEMLILEALNNLKLPEEIINSENPCECGKDLMVFYEEILEMSERLKSSKKLYYSLIFDEDYLKALNNLMREKENYISIFASINFLALKLIKQVYKQQNSIHS